MTGLTTHLLSRACRVFLTRAYPGGEQTIPAARAGFVRLTPDQPLEPLLAPPICQPVPGVEGEARGYSFRLGRVGFPHLKMQVVHCPGTDEWVLAVDTHDRIQVDPSHPDAAGVARLQADNQQLKQVIEQDWEAEGLLTFNALLRRDLLPVSTGPEGGTERQN